VPDLLNEAQAGSLGSWLPVLFEPKNSSYPGAASVGGGVGRPICPTMRWQM
jgi:hypothetical protein